MMEHNPHFGTLSTFVDEYHLTMCVVQPGVPAKPQSEHRTCVEQIYSYAKVHNISATVVDDLMDQAEKKYVLSQQ